MGTYEKTKADLTVAQTWTATQTFGSGLLAVNDVKFPATQVASADVNTLDDYEEGTWTPALADDTLDGSGEGQTYAIQVGRYVKIGNRVYFTCNLDITSPGTLTGGQQARLVGLPFTSLATASTQGSIAVGHGDSLALAAAGYAVTGLMPVNTTYIALYVWNATGGTGNFTVTMMGTIGQLILSGYYEV